MKTEIKCPGCKTKIVVQHLNWSALSCPSCETYYDLAPWLITTGTPNQELNK